MKRLVIFFCIVGLGLWFCYFNSSTEVSQPDKQDISKILFNQAALAAQEYAHEHKCTVELIFPEGKVTHYKVLNLDSIKAQR